MSKATTKAQGKYLIWKSYPQEPGYTLYNTLIKLVLTEGVHLAPRNETTTSWTALTTKFFQQPPLIGFNEVDMRQIRGAYTTILESRAKFHNWLDSSGKGYNLSDKAGDLDELDSNIRQILEDIENHDAKKKLKEETKEELEKNERVALHKSLTQTSEAKIKDIDNEVSSKPKKQRTNQNSLFGMSETLLQYLKPSPVKSNPNPNHGNFSQSIQESVLKKLADIDVHDMINKNGFDDTMYDKLRKCDMNLIASLYFLEGDVSDKVRADNVKKQLNEMKLFEPYEVHKLYMHFDGIVKSCTIAETNSSFTTLSSSLSSDSSSRLVTSPVTNFNSNDV